MDLTHIKSHFSRFIDSPFRSFQESTITGVLESSRPVSVIVAPCGFGKSLTGMSIGQALGNLTYLVHSKSLQSQLLDDYPEAEMLMGRNNYECLVADGLTADNCTHRK